MDVNRGIEKLERLRWEDIFLSKSIL